MGLVAQRTHRRKARKMCWERGKKNPHLYFLISSVLEGTHLVVDLPRLESCQGEEVSCSKLSTQNSLGQRLRGQLLNKLGQIKTSTENHEDDLSERVREQMHQSTKNCTCNFAVASQVLISSCLGTGGLATKVRVKFFLFSSEPAQKSEDKD